MNRTQPPPAQILASVLEFFAVPGAVDWSEIARSGPYHGLSGGEIWRVPAGNALWGVRRWPAAVATPRVARIHHLLYGLQGSGLPLPLPRIGRSGTSWLSAAESIWQVEPWLPGVADFHQDPRPEKLDAACRFLAVFHTAAGEAHGVEYRPRPAIARRLAAFEQHRLAETAYATALRQFRTPRAETANQIFEIARASLKGFCHQLEAWKDQPAPLVPCIRDIWHDHLLFSGASLSGVVDFGGLEYDGPATDLARMLGSLVWDDPVRRGGGIATYMAIRPLPAAERILIDLLDRSGTVIAGLNWIRWLFQEQRTFSSFTAVDQRLAEIGARLRDPAFRSAGRHPTIG